MRRIYGAHILGGIIFGGMISRLLVNLFPWVYDGGRSGVVIYYLQLAVLAYAIYRGLNWAERRIVGTPTPHAG